MASPELLAPVPGAPAALTSGGLLWAFHDGFAAYVARLADGRIDVDGGARLQADGRVFFPFASVTGSGQGDGTGHGCDGGSGPGGHPGTGELRGCGALRFTGHHGLLAVALADPAVVETAGAPVLTIADPFAPGQRMVFAELGPAQSDATAPGAEPGVAEPDSITPGLPSPTVRYAGPLLTEDGADLFFGHYREGTPLAPLDICPTPFPADQDARDD
jgi:hypothetical protein